MAPVGARVPPSGSMVTAIAVGIGNVTGVMNIAVTPPRVSVLNTQPSLIGARRPLRTQSW